MATMKLISQRQTRKWKSHISSQATLKTLSLIYLECYISKIRDQTKQGSLKIEGWRPLIELKFLRFKGEKWFFHQGFSEIITINLVI